MAAQTSLLLLPSPRLPDGSWTSTPTNPPTRDFLLPWRHDEDQDGPASGIPTQPAPRTLGRTSLTPPSLRPSVCPSFPPSVPRTGPGPSAWARTGNRPTVDGWHPTREMHSHTQRHRLAQETGTARAIPLCEQVGAHTIPGEGHNAPDTCKGSRVHPGKKARRPRQATDAYKWELKDRFDTQTHRHTDTQTHTHTHTHTHVRACSHAHPHTHTGMIAVRVHERSQAPKHTCHHTHTHTHTHTYTHNTHTLGGWHTHPIPRRTHLCVLAEKSKVCRKGPHATHTTHTPRVAQAH